MEPLKCLVFSACLSRKSLYPVPKPFHSEQKQTRRRSTEQPYRAKRTKRIPKDGTLGAQKRNFLFLPVCVRQAKSHNKACKISAFFPETIAIYLCATLGTASLFFSPQTSITLRTSGMTSRPLSASNHYLAHIRHVQSLAFSVERPSKTSNERNSYRERYG